MPEVRYRRPLNVPVQTIWEFVEDMNNWAPMLTGYQSHEVKSETESVWTLKGDVGILSRVVKLDVTITEWAGPERVTFELEGINEMVSGGGSFEILELSGASVEPTAVEAQPGPISRLIRWFFRTLFQKKYGQIDGPGAESAEASSELVFTWRMEAGGATGPLVNAMLGPAIEPAAEHLAEQIASHLEGAADNA